MVAKGYGVTSNISDIIAVTQNAPNVIREELQSLAQEVAELGENEMKAIILTSGTEFSDRAREAGINKGPGRYRTGKMYNAVKNNVYVDGNEEDQPGLIFFKSFKTLLDVEDDQGGQQSEQNQNRQQSIANAGVGTQQFSILVSETVEACFQRFTHGMDTD